MFQSLLLSGLLGLATPTLPPASTATAAELPLSQQPFAQVDLGRLEDFRRELTLRLLDHLRDPGFRRLLASRLDPAAARIPLAPLARDWAELWPSPERDRAAAMLGDLERDLRGKLGLDGEAGALLALEVAWPERAPRVLDWDRALFAVRPSRSSPPPAAIEAYDSQGRLRSLDPGRQPEVPVLFAGLDRGAALAAGARVVNQGLAAAGFAAPASPPQPTGPVACGKLTAIRLAESRGGWWLGDMEVYALVSGIDPTDTRPAIRMEHLPYLVRPGTDYYPNQLLVFWNGFRFNAANVQFWLHGDATNYRELLDAILKGTAAAMVAGGLPTLAWIPALADAIVQAMPSSWLADPDTLVDTFYTLVKDQPCQDQDGVRRNARICLVPWTLRPN
jgi:hypothetical protein